jgi:hypothetical protein
MIDGAPDAPWLGADAVDLAALILASHHRTWGTPLVAGTGANRSRRQAAQELFTAATVVLAHDGAADPRLIYANRAALTLWRRRWSEMVGMPSRLTAEPAERRARSAVLAQALRSEAIEGYGGIRIDSSGRRFRIQGARLWTLRNTEGCPCGQAAAFKSWWWV